MLKRPPSMFWLCAAAIARVFSAQSGSSVTSLKSTTGTLSSSVTEAVQTHTISVGKTNNRYSPDIVQAAVGDVIEFQFFPPNHSVARAEYGFPCIPYELTGANKVGFFSGFQPVDVILENNVGLYSSIALVRCAKYSPKPPTWSLTINNTEPIFYYCSAPGSCMKFAMVGVINPNASVSLATQKNDAFKAGYMVIPGERLPTGEIPTSETGAAASASATNLVTATSTSPSVTNLVTATSTSPSQTAAAVTSATNNSSHGHGKLSSGAIAGISIGAVAVAIVVGSFLFLLGQHRTELQFLRRDVRAQDQRPPPPETKHSYDSAGGGPQGLFSLAYPYDSEDPRFREHQAYNVPPYPKEVPRSPQPTVPELPSPSLGTETSRAASPASELGMRRDTMSSPPRGLLESIDTGFRPGGGHGLGLRD